MIIPPSTNETDQKKINIAIQQLAQGRSNAVGTFTLAASATTTTVTDANCAIGSTIVPVPTTAHAAAEIGNGTLILSAVANGSFTFTHASNTQADRTFRYVIYG